MSNFEKAVEWVISKEGGYVNHPSDPGGETNFGISKRVFPEVDIKALTKEKAKELYRIHYWAANNLDSYEWPYSCALFDCFVQHRPSVVLGFHKQANGNIRALLEARRIFYLNLIKKNPSMKVFQKGWMNRLNDLRKFCEINQLSR